MTGFETPDGIIDLDLLRIKGCIIYLCLSRPKKPSPPSIENDLLLTPADVPDYERRKANSPR